MLCSRVYQIYTDFIRYQAIILFRGGDLVNINFLDCDDLNKQITLDKSSISPRGNFASLSDSLGIIHHVTRVSNEP